MVGSVHATTAVESLTFGLSGPGPQQTTFMAGDHILIENTVNLSAASPSGKPANDSLLWIAILRAPGPGGYSVYAEAGKRDLWGIGGGVAGGNATCNIPFGQSSDLSVTNQTGTITFTGCSGSNANWYAISAVQNATTLTNDCDSPSQAPPPYTGSGGVGDTTIPGSYTVYVCWGTNAGSLTNRPMITGTFHVRVYAASSSLQTLSLPFTLLLTTGLLLAKIARKPRRL